MDNRQGPQAGSGGTTVETVFGKDLVLASSSPRRSEILRAVNWPFSISPTDVDESRKPGEGAIAYVERLALEKAEAAARHSEGASIVLGADTVVVIGDEILGKPVDEEDAKRMLRMLSGRWHEVLTGVALVRTGDSKGTRVAHESTQVRFAEMDEDEIVWHVANGSPLDKAGAYAVQGLAALFIREIQGDYWNVVGLPVQLVYKLAREMRSEGKRSFEL
jgi:septum formation protein